MIHGQTQENTEFIDNYFESAKIHILKISCKTNL